MIAAIYARKSTEQSGVSDEEKSVTRQIEHAKAYAVRKGWTPTEECVYVDDGISGAEFVKRPGFVRLMNALKPRPPFQVLVMSEESRFGREQIETAYALKQIMDAGVRVFFYLEDRERTLDSAMDKMMLSLTNFASEMEREKARQRTYDAMLRKAKALQVTGGRVYGYDNVEVLSPTPEADGHRKRLYVVRRINPEQAAIVRRIFEMCAGGKGLVRIAKALNAEGVRPPRHSTGWAPTAIREILHRPLYRGMIVWGKAQKITRGGTKKLRRCPSTEWIKLEAPELCIVDDALWQAVHERLERTRSVYLRTGQGQLYGRPSRLDLESPYLLSGMGRCSICGGAIIAMTRDIGKPPRQRLYGCAYAWKRGPSVCKNSLKVRQDILNHAVLQAIQEVLDEHILEAAVEKALERLRSGQEHQLDRRTAIERELSLIEAQERRLVEAIKRGEAVDPLVSALKAEESRKTTLTNELTSLRDFDRATSLDSKRLAQDIKRRAADVKGLLSCHTAQARQVLRKLLVDRLELTPFEEDGQRGYLFAGQGTFGRLLAGATSPRTPPGSPSLRENGNAQVPAWRHGARAREPL